MNVEVADNMKDTIAFLVARYKDDEEGAMAVLGIKEDPTDDEVQVAGEKVLDMLLLMTDFAISQINMLAMIVGVSTDKMLATLGIQMAKMAERGM